MNFAVNRHVFVDLQVVQSKIVGKVVAPGMPLPAGVVEVRLHEDAVARYVRDEICAFSRVVLDVIETNFHGPVLERQVVIDSFNFERLRICRQRILNDRVLARDEMFK